MPGELTRKAVFAQPEWLRGVPARVGDRRLPDGRVVFTGCGTSFHAAQTGGEAVQALEAVLSPPEADLLVVVSHEGGTSMALEAVRAFVGPDLARHGQGGEPARRGSPTRCSSSRRRWRSPTATRRATRPRWRRSPSCAARTSAGSPRRSSACSPRSRSRSPPTSASPSSARAATCRPLREAALKLREGVHVAAEAHHTEQILHGHLAAIDETVRVFVLEGEGRAAERAAGRRTCARRDRRRDDARADGAPGRRHRAVPAPHARPRGATAASIPTRSVGTSLAGTRRGRRTLSASARAARARRRCRRPSAPASRTG